jgi:hypothetical protein
MDWLDIPNLCSKALAFIGAVLWRPPRPPTTPRLHRIYAGYGTLALLYTGFTAWTVATGYHRFLQAGVGLCGRLDLADPAARLVRSAAGQAAGSIR